jgi:hypothetical protein
LFLGLSACFLIIASLLWTMIDRYPQQPLLPTGNMLAIPLLNMFIALIGALIVIALLARYLPSYQFLPTLCVDRFKSFRAISRRRAATLRNRTGARARNAWHGRHRLATQRQSAFRRSCCRCVTEGEFIARETPVTVIQTDGMRVVVKSAAWFSQSCLSAGNDADELDAVAFSKWALWPFVSMQGEAVVLHQNRLRGN